VTLETALTRGSKLAREHLLGDGTARGAIAAATHLSRNHGTTERLFGTPGGRIDGGIKQKAEEGRPLPIQMPDECPNGAYRGRAVQEGGEPSDQPTAGDRGTVRGDRASRVAVPHGQRILEHALHLPRQERAGMIRTELARAPQQMRHTGLVPRLCELPIRSPAVADVFYYHGSRTHLSLAKDAPTRRRVQASDEGRVIAFPEVGGLHHRYERRAA
jgi:hypothetical protein